MRERVRRDLATYVILVRTKIDEVQIRMQFLQLNFLNVLQVDVVQSYRKRTFSLG